MRHELALPAFTPTSLNKLMYASVKDRIRRKKGDFEVISHYARESGIPLAACRRRVSLVITLGKGQRQLDEDNVWKGLLDSLVCCGLLVDDGGKWCERGPVVWKRGERQTLVILEDLEPVDPNEGRMAS